MFRLRLWILLSLALGGIGAGAMLAQPIDPLSAAVALRLTTYCALPGNPLYFTEAGREADPQAGGVVYLNAFNAATDARHPGYVEIAPVVPDAQGNWRFYLPGDAGYSDAFSRIPAAVSILVNNTPYKPTPVPSRIPRTAYQLPWLDGEWATVTRSYGRHGRGMIDFDLTRREVAAAKSGMIVYARDTSETNAFASGAWWYWNTVIIRHAPGEYSLYGHLAHNSIPAAIRDACTDDYARENCAVPIRAGDVIGLEGSTGYSSNPHLHFELGQALHILSAPDALDTDADGNRYEAVYAPYVYQEQNVGFTDADAQTAAAWPYGTLLQADHPPAPPTPYPTSSPAPDNF